MLFESVAVLQVTSRSDPTSRPLTAGPLIFMTLGTGWHVHFHNTLQGGCLIVSDVVLEVHGVVPNLKRSQPLV